MKVKIIKNSYKENFIRIWDDFVKLPKNTKSMYKHKNYINNSFKEEKNSSLIHKYFIKKEDEKV